MKRRHRLAVSTIVLCTLLWSLAGIVTRQLDHAAGFEITFWRSLACVICVASWLMVTERRSWVAAITRTGLPGLVSGLMWAVMFTCFMVALTLTPGSVMQPLRGKGTTARCPRPTPEGLHIIARGNHPGARAPPS